MSNFGVVATMAELRAFCISATDTILYMMGFRADNDGGQGLFFWDSSSSDEDNSGTVIMSTGYAGCGRWKRLYNGSTVYPEWFGAIGDGVTDDQEAITNCIKADSNIVLRPVTYNLNSISGPNEALTIPNRRTIWAYGTKFKMGASLDTDKICLLISDKTWLAGVSDVSIFGLNIDGNRTNRKGGTSSGHGIFISCCDNIRLTDVTSANNPCDGIEVTGDTTYAGDLSNNVRLQNCLVHNNFRNGLSVTGTRGFRCYGMVATGTNGASPQAGIDVEPNGPSSPNVDFRFYGTRCAANAGDGFLVANSESLSTGIIDGLTSTGNGLYGFESTAKPNDVILKGSFGGSNKSGDFAPGSVDILSLRTSTSSVDIRGEAFNLLREDQEFRDLITEVVLNTLATYRRAS